jgi:hypothetical protein
MNLIHQPPVEPTNGQGPSGPNEDLLRAFFRAEMPHPWPAVRTPERVILHVAPSPIGPRRITLTRSRLALAASLVLLLLSSWLLSGMIRESRTDNGVNQNPGPIIGKPGPGTTPANEKDLKHQKTP